MPKKVLIALVSLAIGLSTACDFVIKTNPDTAKANRLVREGNALQTDGIKLKKEAMDRYAKLVNEQTNVEDLVKLEGPLKDVVAQLKTARAKILEAAQKSADASKMDIPEYFQEYLSLRSELLGKEADIADILLRQVKLTYAPDLVSEADFRKRTKALNAEIANLRTQQTEIQAQVDRIREEHDIEFKG
jgi:peptidoglycan hydrolase CwlO-like protein